jgi:hypothetical protein
MKKTAALSQLFEQYTWECDSALDLAIEEREELEVLIKRHVIPYCEYQVKHFDDDNAQDLLIKIGHYI